MKTTIGQMGLIGLIALLTGCSTIGNALVKRETVTLKPAQTNEVQVLKTNYVEVTTYLTNLVTVVEATTNAVGVVTPAILQPQILPQVMLTPQVTTGTVTQVIPAVTYVSNSLTPIVGSAVRTAGDIAPFPFANTVASGLFGLTTVVLGFVNNRNAAKAKGALTALDKAKLVGRTLVENFEAIRSTALTVPGYTPEIDAKVMKTVQQAQRIAGVKADVHELVEQHTGDTKG